MQVGCGAVVDVLSYDIYNKAVGPAFAEQKQSGFRCPLCHTHQVIPTQFIPENIKILDEQEWLEKKYYDLRGQMLALYNSTDTENRERIMNDFPLLD